LEQRKLFASNDLKLDTGRRELRRGSELIAMEPQVFDLLAISCRTATESSARTT
jgi:DNA-binding winged helix-turn-helix (wHTH) protein